jgi:hypothetical protein
VAFSRAITVWIGNFMNASLAIAPDFADEFVEFVYHTGCLFDARVEEFHVLALEFLAFGVLPEVFGLVPLIVDFAGNGR